MKKTIYKILDDEFLSGQKELNVREMIKQVEPHERRLFCCLSLCEIWLSHTLKKSGWDWKTSIVFDRKKERVLFKAEFDKNERLKNK